jgi:hypothetical protein
LDRSGLTDAVMVAICAAPVFAGLPALARLVRLLVARVTDVAKRRRQEL